MLIRVTAPTKAELDALQDRIKAKARELKKTSSKSVTSAKAAYLLMNAASGKEVEERIQAAAAAWWGLKK